MKKIFLIIAAILSVSEIAHSQWKSQILASQVKLALAGEMRVNNAINWRVGEFQEFDVYASFGVIGKLHKRVTREQGNAVWLVSEMTGMAQQRVEALIDRATGIVLEYYENGQRADDPAENLEIISKNETRVTVPAGTFDATHIVARSERLKKLEVWTNPMAITIDGSAQQVIDPGMITLTMKLVKFGGR